MFGKANAFTHLILDQILLLEGERISVHFCLELFSSLCHNQWLRKWDFTSCERRIFNSFTTNGIKTSKFTYKHCVNL